MAADGEWVARSLGDPGAFEAVFDRYFADVHRYLARRVGADLADDLAAEVFEVAFRRRRRYDAARAEVRPWLFGIAHNVLRQHRRTEVRRLRAYARTGVDPCLAGGVEDVPARVDAQRNGPRLAAGLAALAARDRETLLLHAWADLGYEEVAAALGIPVGTVRSRLHRARRMLREHLGGSGQVGIDTALVPSDRKVT